MKKLIALTITALLALSAVAFAETYRADDITFEYDENAFEISLDDRTDDEITVVLHDTVCMLPMRLSRIDGLSLASLSK